MAKTLLPTCLRLLAGAILLGWTAHAQTLTVNPQAFQIAAAGGDKSFTVDTGATAQPWTVTSQVPWIAVRSGASGAGTGTVVFAVAPNLAGNPRQGTITVQTNSSPSVEVPIAQDADLVIVPASLSFSFRQQGPAPLPQTVVVSATHGRVIVQAETETDSGGNWLFVSGGGYTPVNFTVTVNPAGLRPGTYHGEIEFDVEDGPHQYRHDEEVRVTLQVTSGADLKASPGQLSFQYQVGGPAPVAQQVSLNSSTGASIPYSAAPAAGAPWLQGSGTG